MRSPDAHLHQQFRNVDASLKRFERQAVLIMTSTLALVVGSVAGFVFLLGGQL
jgi:hypothetical protein